MSQKPDNFLFGLTLVHVLSSLIQTTSSGVLFSTKQNTKSRVLLKNWDEQNIYVSVTQSKFLSLFFVKIEFYKSTNPLFFHQKG